VGGIEECSRSEARRFDNEEAPGRKDDVPCGLVLVPLPYSPDRFVSSQRTDDGT